MRENRELHWTADSEAHVARHGITPTEVQEVLHNNGKLRKPGRDESTLIYGATDSGKHLLIVVADAADGRWFAVTARDMTDKEKRRFRRKERWGV